MKTPWYVPVLLGLLLVLLGVGVFLYPVISSYQAQQNQARTISSYVENIAEKQDDSIDSAMEEARRYNEALAGDPVRDPFVPGSGYALPDNYQQVLNPGGDGIMGYLEIPKLGIRLPIGHGTSEEVLETMAGHIESTALPIGGPGTHSVLTGHRGLPSAELLTRLDEMEDGDLFLVKILDQTLAYQVDQITTVLPYELQNLQTVPGKDFVTILTCTPYGVNTHRLLVRGQRTEYIPQQVQLQSPQVRYAGLNMKRLVEGTVLGFCMLAVLLIVLLLTTVIRRRRRRNSHD